MPQNEGLKKLEDAINNVLLIKDPHITKFLAACVIAHFLPADPVWPVIVAPSGGAKSEFINMLSLIHWTPPGKDHDEKVHPVSTLTSHTFVSGLRAVGKETSLLLQIKNGIITFKDLTSLLSEHKDDRSIIMAQLREIFDGKYNKSFGTGLTIDWAGKITIIAGSTYAIHSLKQSYSALGERFVFYNMIQPKREDAAERTMENQEEGKMAENRQHLAEMFFEYCLDVLKSIPTELPKVEKATRIDLIALAELATRARSDVERNWLRSACR
jgi:hypothetical protein